MTLSACAEAPLDYETYLHDYDIARCKRRVRCAVISDVEGCLQRLTDPLTPDPDVRDAIHLEKMTFHVDAAAACIEWIENVTCDVTSPEFRRPNACNQIFTGALHDGETCAFSDECISNECWDGDVPCTDACCTGTCAGDIAPEFGHLGDRCRLSGCIDSRCGDDGICAPFRTEGELCEESAECDYGLGCVNGVCTALAGAGEACSVSGCRDYGFVCKEWPSFACEPGGLGLAHCLDDSDCSPMYRCETSSNNIDTYFCTQRVALAVGSECRWFETPCAPPAFCKYSGGSVGRCTLPLANGERCGGDAQCESQRCDDLGVCTSKACL